MRVRARSNTTFGPACFGTGASGKWFCTNVIQFSTFNLKIDHESSWPRPNTTIVDCHIASKHRSKQGYKCPKKLLNCMENQVKTQTRMSIWPKLLRPERLAKSPRGIHVAPVAGSIGSGKYVSSQGWTYGDPLANQQKGNAENIKST